MTNWVIVVLAGGAAGLVGTGWFAGYGEANPAAPLLNAKEQAVLVAVADAMFPRGGVLPIAGSDAGVLRFMNETLRTSSLRMSLLMRLLLRVVEHGPWVVNGRARLTKQTPAERVATLQSWSESPIYLLRVVFTSIRTLVSLAYLADDDVVRTIGASPNQAPFEPAVST